MIKVDMVCPDHHRFYVDGIVDRMETCFVIFEREEICPYCGKESVCDGFGKPKFFPQNRKEWEKQCAESIY